MVANTEQPATARLLRDERGVTRLFAALAREISRLFAAEVALARAEIGERLGTLGAGAASLIAGGALLYAGLLAWLVAAGFALAIVLPPWAAALIVGGIVLLAGAVLVFKGRHDLSARNLTPRRTLRSLRDDAEWAREQVR